MFTVYVCSVGCSPVCEQDLLSHIDLPAVKSKMEEFITYLNYHIVPLAGRCNPVGLTESKVSPP